MGFPSILLMGGSAGSGGGGAAFSTIQPDAGTSPVATGADTLTLTCVDNALTITGDAATDKITFGAGTALALLGGRAAGQTLNGSTASAGALILSSTAHGTKGLIQLGADSAYDEALIRFGIGRTDPGYRLEVRATADNYSHGMAISHSLGGANALTRFYQDLNGTFSIGNPNQQTATLVSDPFGKVGLGNGATSGNSTINVRTHPDYLGRCSLMITKVASQTGKLLMITDTDFASEFFSVDVTGKFRWAASLESAATLGTAPATEYLTVLLSDGSTRYIPLVTTPN